MQATSARVSRLINRGGGNLRRRVFRRLWGFGFAPSFFFPSVRFHKGGRCGNHTTLGFPLSHHQKQKGGGGGNADCRRVRVFFPPLSDVRSRAVLLSYAGLNLDGCVRRQNGRVSSSGGTKNAGFVGFVHARSLCYVQCCESAG